MTEYWLQKKGLSGWSTVTWYSDLEQAMTNYRRAIDKGMSGYSWRLMKVEAIEVSMLEEVTEIEPPAGLAPDVLLIPKSEWANRETKGSGWGVKLNPEQQADVNQAWGSFKTCNTVSAKPEHGLTGSVWVIHHGLKHKARVWRGELELYLEKGYERGGPKTKFRE